MTDESTISPAAESVAESASAAPAKQGKFKAFFATTLGKVVVIGCAVSALLTVLGVVAIIVLGAVGFSMLGSAVDEATKQGLPPASQGATGTVEATATVPGVSEVPLGDIFVPRDPFQPVILPASELGGATAADDENTLTLLEIVEDNGVLKAVLQLGANKYTLGAGETVAGSPWQVVSVGSNSVVMLYGDSQINLTVGQGISMK